jgi:uncharacterized protein YndB with AHSA1/START domain
MYTALLIILLVVAAVAIYAATRPNSFRVERSLLISASPERIFALINDFHAWTKWSPYENLDPNLQRSYSGAASGQGAAYAWQGNGKAGKGSMTIAQSQPPSHIAIDLDFIKPFRATNKVDFTIAPEGGAARVTWAMQGQWPYMAKLMGLFMNMDNLIGRDFEKGLANLKAETEHA